MSTLTVSDILNVGIERLSTNTYGEISISFKSQIKELVIPFFVDYMEAYTAEMYRVMVSHIKSLVVQSKWLDILMILAEKSNKEKGLYVI